MRYRKLFAVILACAMVMLAGCQSGSGGDSTDDGQTAGNGGLESQSDNLPEPVELEPVHLRWMIIGADRQKDHNAVVEKFNEMLADKLPNTTVDIEVYSDFGDKWQIAMASSEAIDLAWAGFAVNFLSEIKKDAYMPLDDLIAEYAPVVQAEIPIFESDFQTGSYNGVIYGIPNHQPSLMESIILWVPTELEEYIDMEKVLDIAHSSRTSTQELWDELEKYLEKVDEAGMLGKGANPETLYKFVSRRGFDFILGENYPYATRIYDNGEVKIENFFESEEYQIFIETMRRWYEKGYIRKDILTLDDTTAENAKIGGTVMYAHSGSDWYQMDDEKGIKRDKMAAEGEILRTGMLLDLPEQKFEGATIIGLTNTYTTIPTTSQNPERAMMLVNLLRSEEGADLFNLLCFGFEGDHYEKVGDNNIVPNGYIAQGNNDSPYGLWKWALGNVYNAYETPDMIEGKVDYCFNYNSDVRSNYYKTPLYGFSFETEDVQSQIDQISAVITEYNRQLWSGALAEYANVYDSFVSKLSSAGMQAVLDEAQSQAEAFMAR